MALSKNKIQKMNIKKQSEKFINELSVLLKLDINYFLKGSFWTFLSQFITTIMGMLLLIAFTNLMSQENFGKYQFIFSILGIASVFTVPGLNQCAINCILTKKEHEFKKTADLKFKFSLISSLILIACSGYFFLFDKVHPHIGITLLLLSLVSPLIYGLDIWLMYYVAKKEFKHTFMYQMTTVGCATLAVTGSLLFIKNPYLLVIIYHFCYALGSLGIYLSTRKKVKRSGGNTKEILSKGLHLSLLNALPSARKYVDKLIITFFLGFVATAIFSIASTISEQVNTTIKSLNNIIYPKIAEHDAASRKIIIKQKIKLLMIVLGSVTLFAIILTEPFINLVIGKEYESAIRITWYLLGISIISALVFLGGKLLELDSRFSELYKINYVSAILEIGGYFLLIPAFGLLGVVISKGIAAVVSLIQLALYLNS